MCLGQSTVAALLFLPDKLVAQDFETQLRKSCKPRNPDHQIKPTALQADLCEPQFCITRYLVGNWGKKKEKPQTKKNHNP